MWSRATRPRLLNLILVLLLSQPESVVITSGGESPATTQTTHPPLLREYYGLRSQVCGGCNCVAGKATRVLVDHKFRNILGILITNVEKRACGIDRPRHRSGTGRKRRGDNGGRARSRINRVSRDIIRADVGHV